MINAAFTLHNFWDRRARNIFNGVSVHGAGDKGARVLRATGLNHIAPVTVRIDNASLASQAVGPPLSDREMGSLGRTFLDIGKRLASAKPLRQQKVTPTTACSGPTSTTTSRTGHDLSRHWSSGVQAAWWRSNLIVVIAPNGSISFVPRPNRPLRDNEYTHARIQLLVVLRAVGAALRDDADLRRRADRPLLRGQHQRAHRPGAPRHGRSSTARRRTRRARLPLRRRVHRQLASHSYGAGGRWRAAAGRDGRAHVQRRVRSGGLRPGRLQPRRPAHRRGSRPGQQRSVRQPAVVHQAPDDAPEPDSVAGAADVSDSEHRQSADCVSASGR